MGDFAERIDQLIEDVGGSGRVTGKVRVDQVYAAYQHFRTDLRHRVGHARFLSLALTQGYRHYLQSIADQALEPDGVVRGMISAMESLANSSSTNTPVQRFNLARSASVIVKDKGATVYRRPAQQGRLSKQQLKQLRRGYRRGR